jgi:hypothetical protein
VRNRPHHLFRWLILPLPLIGDLAQQAGHHIRAQRSEGLALSTYFVIMGRNAASAPKFPTTWLGGLEYLYPRPERSVACLPCYHRH